eukprot:scaffold16045_cov110-Isochrysis_galbana.AAC.5
MTGSAMVATAGPERGSKRKWAKTGTAAAPCARPAACGQRPPPVRWGRETSAEEAHGKRRGHRSGGRRSLR